MPRLEAPRVVEQPGVFTLRPWDETDDPVAIVADLAGAAATAAIGDRRGPGSSSTCSSDMPSTSFTRRVEVTGAAAGRRRTPPRSTRCDGPARPPTAWRRRCRPATSPLVGRTEAEVSAEIIGVGCSPRATIRSTSRSSPRARTPRARTTTRADARHPQRRGRALRLRRHARRLLQRHHPLRVTSAQPSPEVRDAYDVLLRSTGRGGGGGHRGHAVRGRRRRRSRRSSRAPATARSSSTAPATASASRSTRTRTSSRATSSRSRPATRSRSSPGSTSQVSFGLRLEDIVVATDEGPDAMNRVAHELVVVDA